MAEYWTVIYKAVADFGDLRREAEKAKQDLQDMADQARAFNKEETDGAAKSVQARQRQIQQLQQETQALNALGSSAKQTNSQLLYGGRTDMQQHLSDMDRLLQYTNLLNRAQWMNFSTVQQAMAYRQQMYQQKLLENRAEFGGYLTPDQFLSYMAKRVQAANLDTAAIEARARAVRDETGAYLAHQNALTGQRQSIGQLGEGVSALGALSDALNALPDTQVTKLVLDDSQFLSQLAADRQLLAAMPQDVKWSAEVLPARPSVQLTSGRQGEADAARMLREEMSRLAAAAVREEEAVGRMISRAAEDFQGGNRYLAPETYRPGGEFARQPGKEMVVKAEFDDVAARSGLAMWVHELLDAVQRRYEFFAVLDDTQALTELDNLMARFRGGETGALRLAAGMGGASGGGGGGGPPPGAAGISPGDDGSARALREEMIRLAAAEDNVRAGAGLATRDFLTEEEAAANLAAAMAAVRAAMAAGAEAERGAAAGARAVGGAIPPMVDGLVASTGGWFGLNSQLRLFGGLMPGVLGHVAAWHVLIDFIIEGLAVFIPALVTLAADLTAFGVAGYDAGKQVYDRIVAIHTASDALQQTLAPMTGQLEKLHDQVRPMVWQLYGDAIDIAHTKTGLFNQLALQTGGVIDRLAAHITVFATGASKGLETFFRIGNQDLAKLGTFFDNLGRALLALIKVTQETHVDQIFLNFFVVLSQLLVLITKLPTPILAAAVGLHAFYLWGGLAATVVMQLLGPLRALALALGAVDAAEVAGGLAGVGKDASAFARLKAGLTDIVAGLAAVPGRFNIFSKAAGEAGTAAEGAAAGEAAAAANTGILATALAKIGGVAGLATGGLVILAAAAGAFAYLSLTARDNAQKWIDTLNTGLGRGSLFTVIGRTVSDLAAVTEQLGHAQGLSAQAAHELAGEQAGLTAKLGSELDHVGQVSHAYGVSMPMALALLNAAGVKTSDLFTAQGKVWEQDLQQVRGLVDGYKAMGQGMTEIQRDVSVQLVMSSDQLKAMDKLNQAWDTFQKLTAGPFTGIVKVAQDVNALAGTAGSMVGLSHDALDTQKNFQGMYNDVETLFSALRSSEAVTGDSGFSGAVKHAVQALIPLAGGNKAAAAEISQLAQEAGGPATTSLQQLGKWAGNTHDPLKALYQDSLNATVGASNLDADAARLTTTLQNDLNPAMAAAAFNALGGQKAFSTFAADLVKLGPDAGPTIKAGRAVADELLAVDKNSVSAKAQFVGWAESMGLSRDAANKLWGEVYKGQKPVEDLRRGLASSATASDNLAKSGFFAQRGDVFRANMREMATWFGTTLPGFFEKIPGFMAGSWSKSFEGFMRTLGSPVAHWFTVSLPNFVGDIGGGIAGDFRKWWNSFHGNFIVLVGNALVNMIPGWMGGLPGHMAQNSSQMWKAFSSAVASPMGRFFTATVPGWFAQVASFFSGSWNKSWAWFGSVIGGGFNRFWTKTIPGWFNQVTSFFTGSWGRSWSWFNGNIIGGFSRFFGSTIPSWITGMEHGFTRAWDNIWSAFQGAGKNAVNWVITHVINHGVIDLINSITGVFGIPKIQYVGTVAAGGDIGAAPGRFVRMAAGSVPGTGDEDGTPIIAMGGEWMLRKPARMALQSQFGPDFLPFLNQADTWLGAGSRGSAATQRPRSNSLPFPARPYASGGQIASEAERFIGAPYVYGGTSPAGWDCSGFVQYVLSQLGWHNVPRTSEAQYGWAHHTANPAVGGLVFAQFPGDNAPPGHVGFYVGSGNVLSARDPALGTGIDRLSSWGGHIVGYGDEPNATGLIGQVVGALGSFVSATVGSIEGLLSGDGSALAAGVSGVARFIGGGAGSLLKLAERGARALFDAGWDHTIGPLVGQVPPGTIEGSSVRYAADTIKKGVDHFLGAKDSAAQQAAAASGGVGGAGAIGPVVGPADQGPAQAMNYAVGKLGAYGWGGGQFPPLRSLWNQESGWNRLARNPSSGAYGIPQSLPPTKLPAAGQAGGGSHASPQIDWGLNYIKTTPGYGSPAAAWAHEQAHNWYPSGGAVGEVPVPYLAGFHTGQAHNVLVAAGLRPTAAPGQKASWWTTGTDPRATTHVPPHSAVSIHAHKSSSREGIRVPDLAGYTAGMAHNILVAEGLVPVADRGQRATWMVTGSSPPKGAGTKAGAHVRIIAPAPKTPPPPGTPAPRGGDAGQNWTYYSGQLARAKADETSALWAYVGAHLPKLTVPQWEGDYSDRLILAWQQQNLYSAYNKVAAGLHDPVSMTAAQWTGLQHQAALQKNWIYGDTPPRSVWGAEKTGAGGLSANWPKGYKPGTYTPSGWARWKYAHGAWAAANAKAKALDSTIGGAYKAWNALYGPGGPLSTGVIFGGGTPGITVLPSGGPSTPPITVDLEPLIGGGPAHPVVTTGPSLSGTGSGFAMGGPVGGDGASLGQVAGMFAMGGLVPSDGLPAMGLPPQLARQLSASTADQGTPRTMSAAGDRIGVSVGNLTIHNPLPEKPSDSIVRSSNRLAFLGGR